MLEIKEIWKTFNAGTVNEKQALRGVSLTLNEGDFCTVIGGNGAGKSTMLNAVAGTWPVDAGTISIGGTDVTHLPEHKRAAFIGRVFQDPMMGTAPTMQIVENLALAARRGQRRGLRWGLTKAEKDRYQEMLKNVSDARIVITHGGPSSFIMPLQVGKIPIVIPRKKEFNEHVNNHQIEFSRIVQERMKTIIVVENINNLGKTIKEYDEIVFGMNSEINYNNAKFCDEFEKIVNEIVMQI